MHRRAATLALMLAQVLLVTLPPAAPTRAAGSWSFTNVLAIGTGGFNVIRQ